MTSNDLRALMSTELDSLAPMPDLVPQVIRKGATQVRRRRLAVGGLVAAAAIGGVAVAPWASGRSQESDSQPADGGGSSAVPSEMPTPSPVALSGSLVLADLEVMAAFDAALPERFSPVRLRQDGPVVPAPLVTDADGVRMRIQVELSRPEATDQDGSASEGQAQSDGSSATAWISQGAWSATVRVSAEPATQQLPISEAELAELVEHPKFLAMLDSRESSDLVLPSGAPTEAPTPMDPPLSDAPGADDAPAPTEAPSPSGIPTAEPTEPSETFSTGGEPTTQWTDPPAPTAEPTTPPSSVAPTPSDAPAPTAAP